MEPRRREGDAPHVVSRALGLRRRLLHRLARAFVAATMQVEARGLHHLLPGPVLLAPNHLSHLDPVVVTALLDSPPAVVGLAELQQEPVAPLFRLYGVIPVRRGAVDRDVLRDILDALARDERVLIFPEARISRTGALEEARAGVGYLALHADVPVVPIAITGTEGAVHAWKRLRRPRVSVTVAPAFSPAPDATQPRRAQRQAITEDVMRRIAAQLPAAYQGFYRGLGT